MEDKSKKTEKCEKNVTKILFSDFSPSFLRFNGHNVMYSAAAHCIHHGQTPYNHDNRTKSLRVTAKASRGRGPRAARTVHLPPGTRGTRTPQWSGQCHWAPGRWRPWRPALGQWWEHRDEFTCNHMPTCDPRTWTLLRRRHCVYVVATGTTYGRTPGRCGPRPRVPSR